MSVFDPLPLHKQTNERSAEAKRKMILIRVQQLRDLADRLQELATDPVYDDRTMTLEANFWLEHT